MFSKMGFYWPFLAVLVYLGRSDVNAALSSDEIDAMMEVELPMLMECLETYGLSLDKLEEIMDNPPDSYYCFVDCFFKKIKIVDEHGMFNPDKVLDNVKRFVKNEETISKIEEAAKDCSKVNEMKIEDGDEKCERARFLSECLEDFKDIFE